MPKRINAVIIKIGQQEQADKPIYLYNNGSIVCGNFTYRGKHMSKFAEYYKRILDLTEVRPRNNVLDVSDHKYWNAINIYDDIIIARWQTSISASKLRKLASQTAIRNILLEIQPEFKRALGRRWLHIFRTWDRDDSDRPSKAWQIL